MLYLIAHSRLLNRNVNPHLSHLLHVSFNRRSINISPSYINTLGPGHVVGYQSEGEVWYLLLFKLTNHRV